ncbi:MAG: 16S rRNA (cytosine(1402)-N(4))-methyltransferase RsmH [Butyrivibrio sp.]|uniref:16S rRNA (cytosine(1402)-N(4))-methyltransferase RsmH n=1 Tax=Butyrivibrio sp. TaxID=28121 RepID=UPI0025F8C028|nr:16S rRNA (cytosine(1402)-N(4))-methyltransferase RsmH [Butyrivibrio sp.]MCR5769980.1 16S rRNA (cytosine(1402)-N(4))-methyltransferase RsmH [Butyrivibrio sp.]
MEFKHTSVLLNEVIDNLNIKPDGIYLDGTLGGAGHSSHIAEKLTAGGHLYGIDQDEDAIAAATKRLEPYKDRVTIIRDNYENAVARLKEIGVTGVDGILIDLGVSSYQLDAADRGFSYKYDAPLDMRMDRRQSLTAKEIINEWPETEIYHIIRDYGEDKFARNIAKHICIERQNKVIETTGELDRIVHESIPAKMRTKGGNPSKRTFQAIRIACNRELDVLQDSLDGMIDFLNPGGRFCVITFHSLEDRITKVNFKNNENPCTCPPEFPVCVCGKKSKGKVITRKPILPSQEELDSNTRSASAKLRVFEKVADVDEK